MKSDTEYLDDNWHFMRRLFLKGTGQELVLRSQVSQQGKPSFETVDDR